MKRKYSNGSSVIQQEIILFTMATIYGGKVKEPKVTRRSTLPVEKKAAYAEGRV